MWAREASVKRKRAMRPRPAHLGPQYAAQFQDAAVVAAYPTRPPYPAAVFTQLRALVAGPSVALDAGCGTGDIARLLAPSMERVDAVDVSAPMIEAGQRLPGGDAPNLRWLVGALEDAPLSPPYGLIVCGESLHWMDWAAVLPRFHAALAPGAWLAMAGRIEEESPWSGQLRALINQYSTNHDYQPYSLREELRKRGLYREKGEAWMKPETFAQPIADYIESIHSRNGFSRDRMTPENADAFDASVRALITPYAPGGVVTLRVSGGVRWGEPLAGGGNV